LRFERDELTEDHAIGPRERRGLRIGHVCCDRIRGSRPVLHVESRTASAALEDLPVSAVSLLAEIPANLGRHAGLREAARLLRRFRAVHLRLPDDGFGDGLAQPDDHVQTNYMRSHYRAKLLTSASLTAAGWPAKLLTFDATRDGRRFYVQELIAVKRNAAYFLVWWSDRGHEAVDRSLFGKIFRTFRRIP
jgi:hypothetical protein